MDPHLVHPPPVRPPLDRLLATAETVASSDGGSDGAFEDPAGARAAFLMAVGVLQL